VTATRSFPRSFDSLEEIFAFTSEFFGRHELDRDLLPTVDLVLEELFTNMVKYSPAARPRSVSRWRLRRTASKCR
jgi:anti-sigma regulatory factor (Ser/Thr protein kinase)